MEWISVKDRLPKNVNEMECIVCNGEDVTFSVFSPTKNCFIKSNENTSFIILGVKHWMPLPKPPKE